MEAYGKSIGRRAEQINFCSNNDYIEDCLAIATSKSFKRLGYKTQVLSSPQNCHVRRRSDHTMEVIRTSLKIATRLNLNLALCAAIAAGHDIGHTPYGHLGEEVLSEYGENPFNHHVHGVVIAQEIERKGIGLNLCFETLEGMLLHSQDVEDRKVYPEVPNEYGAVAFADDIAYTFSDLNDAIRYGYLKENRLPDYVNKLGNTEGNRIGAVVESLARESIEKGYIDFSESEEAERFIKTKNLLKNKFYSKVDRDIQKVILVKLCDFFTKNYNEFMVDPILMVSLLTDMDANNFGRLLLDSERITKDHLKRFGVMDIVEDIAGKHIDYTKPNLEWGENLKNALKEAI